MRSSMLKIRIVKETVAGISVVGAEAEKPRDKEVKTVVTTCRYTEICAIELNKNNKLKMSGELNNLVLLHCSWSH